jgi:hypothetical protein
VKQGSSKQGPRGSAQSVKRDWVKLMSRTDYISSDFIKGELNDTKESVMATIRSNLEAEWRD